jgi:hypothetical protein
MKKHLFFILTAALAALVSCQKTGPEEKEPVWVEIPFSVKAEVTKVSYDAGYSRKDGDKLSVRGATREDISGVLDYDSGEGKWTGNLRYLESEGEPVEGVTALTVTLVHADNDDESTYGHGLMSVSTLKDAAERLSLLTGSLIYGDMTPVTLYQQATFVETTVSFTLVGISSMPTGETPVDVIIGGDIVASGMANLQNVAASGEPADYKAHFFIALPGSTTITDSDYIEICDRDVPLRDAGASAVTLVANKRYTMNRSHDFKPELGDPYWSDGTYGRISHRPGVEVVGIIVYVNNDDTEDSRALTEYSYGYGHALVMALHNAAEGVAWGEKTLHTESITRASQVIATTNVSGYNNTTELETNVAAANYARNYRNNENDVHQNDSGWFLPSIGQWAYAISEHGFGGADPVDQWKNSGNTQWTTSGSIGNSLIYVKSGSTNENLLVKSLNDRLEVLKTDFGCAYDSFGMTVGSDFSDNYWSSSEYDASNAIRLNFGSVEKKGSIYYTTIKINKESKVSTWTWKEAFPMKVRPFLAF